MLIIIFINFLCIDINFSARVQIINVFKYFVVFFVRKLISGWFLVCFWLGFDWGFLLWGFTIDENGGLGLCWHAEN